MAEELHTFKVLKPLGFDISQCQMLNSFVTTGKYALLGLASKIRNRDVNIAPSLVYAIESLPSVYIERDIENVTLEVDRGCNVQTEMIDASFEVYGVIDSGCVSNDQIMKGHLNITEGVGITQDAPTECSETLTGYKYQPIKDGILAQIYQQSVQSTKDLISRTGPLLISTLSEPWTGSNLNAIIIGWTDTDWIIWKQERILNWGENADYQYIEDTVPFTDSLQQELQFEVWFFYVPEQNKCVPISDTTLIECPCQTTDDPRTDKCQSPVDEPEQPCVPTKDTTLDECGCLEKDDPRADTLCKTEEKDSADSVRAALSSVVTFVLISAFVLFI
ncbi:MAG: hypothetical protein EZS28_039677 [Streblomastix strix]|uniref:Uncharacterized protein n=1 Tax=Streblomastix strix TaxID=222440 RepID=A0A5J4U240_9EUKA|nr:MAG: hypothetical protein EZS28_039677 [Streblomastix strix]